LKDQERLVVTGVLGILLLGWLGFLVHQSPRFAGTGIAALFGIAGAALMIVPLAYTLAKRVSFLRARITNHISMQSLLTLHVYTGILGPLLALVHTGHKFDSLLGISLTGAMMLVVVSGYAARYLLKYVNREIKDKLVLLQTARGDLDHAWGVLETMPAGSTSLSRTPLVTAGLASFGFDVGPGGAAGEVTRIAESVADLEYAIRTHEALKRWFARSLKLHIFFSMIFYVLLALHIGSGIYFGLRWLR